MSYLNRIFGGKKKKIPTSNTIPIPVPQMNNQPQLITEGVNPIGMSYWRNIDNHEGKTVLRVFLSISNELTIFTIDKNTLQVIGMNQIGIYHTGEGCYFSRIWDDILYVPVHAVLYRVNVITGNQEMVWNLSGGSDDNLWQCHSSYDETLHSGTIKNSNYDIVAWGLSDGRRFKLEGVPDECQIDKSGKWLLVKENDYNRIIDLDSGEEKFISNENGALGHSDCGFGYALGENDVSDKPGALDLIEFGNLNRRNLYSTGIWNMGYVSYTNAPGENCLVTTPNELILVSISTGLGRKICDNLTQDQSYENRPKANLCPLGQFAAWTAFVNGKLNAYIVRI